MKTLPKEWFVDIEKEKNSPFLDKFKEWFQKRCKFSLIWDYDQYGFDNKDYGTYDCGKELSLREWNDMAFGVKEQFEQGEEVLVKDKNHDEWVSVLFVCTYNGFYVADWEGDVDCWDECKKKPSKLDLKIEELKKLAQENGVKLTIISE